MPISSIIFRAMCLAGTAIAVTATPVAAAAQDNRRSFDIPAQAASGALNEWARQAGAQIVFPYDAVSGRSSPGLRGRFTPDEALARLIAPLGLRVASSSDGIVTLRAGGADASGEGAAADGAAENDPEIVVTGTNLRGAQPTSPLITISRRQIDESGATSAEDLIRKLPQNFSGGVGDENFYVSQPGVNRLEPGAGLNLRGLGQRATLTLVNGRRLAPANGGAFTDISLIPITAVERVEVLTDGASAIYGSDAVGGVVNFILRDDFDGLETIALVGSATSGDGDQLQLGMTGGHAWGSGHALLSYEYRREDEILAGDRDFTIGRNPDGYILPRQRRHSILGLVEQQLAPALAVELNGSYSRRQANRSFYALGNPSPNQIDQDSEQVSLGGELRADLGNGWAARAEVLYSRLGSEAFQSASETTRYFEDRTIRTETLGFGLKADGDLIELPGGAVQVALGAEIRREDYTEDVVALDFTQSLASDRTVRAAFAELLVPVFSSRNRQPGFEQLRFSAAGRYEDYGRLGSSFDPKIGVLWSPIPDLALRASFGTSFRVPLLSEAGGQFYGAYAPAAGLYVDPSQASGLGIYLLGLRPDLRPESSRTWAFGGEFTPRFAPGLTLSANYYTIRFSDRIAMVLTAVNVVGNPAFESLVTRNPTLQQVLAIRDQAFTLYDYSGAPGGARPEDVTVILDARTQNTAVTTTRGMDFGARYTFGVGQSRFVLDANVNHIISFNDQLTAQSPPFSNFNIPYRPLAWRGRAALSWTRGPLGAALAVNHAGGYRDLRAAIARRVDSFTTLDATLSYRVDEGPFQGTRVALFVENLLDTDPPFLAPDRGATAGSGYDAVNASARGRFISLQLRKTW